MTGSRRSALATPGAQAAFPGADRSANDSGVLGPALARLAQGDDQTSAMQKLAAGGAQVASLAPRGFQPSYSDFNNVQLPQATAPQLPLLSTPDQQPQPPAPQLNLSPREADSLLNYWGATHSPGQQLGSTGGSPLSYFNDAQAPAATHTGQPWLDGPITNRLFGLSGAERYQLFPERLVRGIGRAIWDVANTDPIDRETGQFKPSAIEDAMNIVGLAGGAPIVARPGIATLGSGAMRPLAPKVAEEEGIPDFLRVENRGQPMPATAADRSASPVPAASIASKVLAPASPLDNANYAQLWYSPEFKKTGPLAGHTVEGMTAALRSGAMKPSDLDVHYVIRDGHTLILNTRTAAALTNAGSHAQSGMR
jgi:hypothetical protein